jgi:hypothetical protein
VRTAGAASKPAATASTDPMRRMPARRPYAIYRLEPTTIFALPGMFGMDQAEGELPKPTRYEFEEN